MSDHDKEHIDTTANALLTQIANTSSPNEQLKIVRDALQYAYACGSA